MAQPTTAAFGNYPHTQSIWSLVKQLKNNEQAAEALNELLRRYRPPLKAHLVRKKKLSSDRADDVLQDFMVSKILRHGLIERADLAAGRFRSFLLTALDRFLIDQSRKRKDPTLELEAIAEPCAATPDEEQSVFHVSWAGEVIAAATSRMREECQTSGRPEVWGIFEDRFLNAILKNTEPASYSQLVTRFSLKSPAQASNLLITGKRMFQRALESVVAEYETGDAQVREELDDLKAVLARAGAM